MPDAPSPPATPIWGHARAFQRDPLGFLLRTARDYGPVVRLRLGPLIYHLVTSPELVEEVLTARAGNYLRDTRSSRNIKLVTGESLLCCEGEIWRRHRRLAQPIFHHRRLAALATMMADTARETAERWARFARAGDALDLASEMNRLTFLTVGRCLFGAELGERADEVEEAFPLLLAELFRRAENAFSFPIWLPTPRHRRFQHALARVDRVVDDVIATRRGASADRADLLSLLLEARDEDGSSLSNEELRNHTITFLLAGHETTSSTLTWTFCLLARHPEIRAAVETELTSVLGDHDPTVETVPQLPLLDAVLRESLRLYPSIWIGERRVAGADELGGYTIPGNSTVVLSAYVTQRLDAYWPQPDAFRPERFLKRDELPTVGGDGYFPFGAGPHQCIGQHFALLEAKLALAILLRRFRVELVELKGMPDPLGGITLRPRDAVPIRIQKI